MLPLSAGFESYLQLFTLGLHQAKENAAQGIRAFFFENRLNNERSIANVIGRFCIQRIFLWPVDLAGICSFILHDKYAGDVHSALVALGWDLDTAAEFLDRIPDAK